jgi:tetratricopeptide (TPR) repeat protein
MSAKIERPPEFDSKWNYADPAATEAEFRRLFEEEEPRGDREYLAQLLTQIARAQGLQMKFEGAFRTLDRGEALITSSMPVARVRVLLERGRLHNSSKQPEPAKAFFLEAWDRARAIHADGYAVDAAHMLGIVESGDDSLEWNRRALDLARTSNDPSARRWMGSLYNNLGWAHHAKGEFAEAHELFVQALAARKEVGAKETIQVARWCVARALRSLDRIEEALALQHGLLTEGSAEGAPDGFVHEEIAECLLSLGRAKEAAPHFAAAYALLSKDPWLSRDEPDRLERLKRLGHVTSG